MATKRTPEQNRAIYARRKARAAAQGTTVFGRRQAAAQRRGWRGYSQEAYWRHELTDERVREMGEDIGGPVEDERPNALFSRETNAIINPRGEQRRPGDWRIRLLVAHGDLDDDLRPVDDE